MKLSQGRLAGEHRRDRLRDNEFADYLAPVQHMPALPSEVATEPSLIVTRRSGVEPVIEPGAEELACATTRRGAALEEGSQHTGDITPLSALKWRDRFARQPGLLIPAIEASMPDQFPKTGLKVGMAAGILAVKKVGVRGTNEPVWAGKPVNWATKCAAAAERNELIVTRRVFQKFERNDYVTHCCDCGTDPTTGERTPGLGVPKELWTTTRVEMLPEEDIDCKLLKSCWCPNHGDEFCTAILEGKTRRDDVQRPLAA
jgi:hypothetical protein